MRYTVTNDFIKINETKGTVQNLSQVNAVEVSDKAELNSGILLYPLNKFTFCDETIYLRCTGEIAEVSVVPFIVDAFAGISGTSSISSDSFNQTDVDDIFIP